MNRRKWEFSWCNGAHYGPSIGMCVPSSTVGVCIWKSQKKCSATRKIFYGIKYIFCVDTFNENAYT